MATSRTGLKRTHSSSSTSSSATLVNPPEDQSGLRSPSPIPSKRPEKLLRSTIASPCRCTCSCSSRKATREKISSASTPDSSSSYSWPRQYSSKDSVSASSRNTSRPSKRTRYSSPAPSSISSRQGEDEEWKRGIRSRSSHPSHTRPKQKAHSPARSFHSASTRPTRERETRFAATAAHHRPTNFYKVNFNNSTNINNLNNNTNTTNLRTKSTRALAYSDQILFLINNSNSVLNISEQLVSAILSKGSIITCPQKAFRIALVLVLAYVGHLKRRRRSRMLSATATGGWGDTSSGFRGGDVSHMPDSRTEFGTGPGSEAGLGSKPGLTPGPDSIDGSIAGFGSSTRSGIGTWANLSMPKIGTGQRTGRPRRSGRASRSDSTSWRQGRTTLGHRAVALAMSIWNKRR